MSGIPKRCAWDCRCSECMRANAGNPREARDVCALCVATLVLYADDGGKLQGWLCPECDREHADELHAVHHPPPLCYKCKSRERGPYGLCAGCETRVRRA